MTPVLSRVLTAILLLAVFVPAVLWAPAWLWAILMAGVVGMAAYEWARLSHFPPLSARAYAVLLTLCARGLAPCAGCGLAGFPDGADRACRGFLAVHRAAVAAGALACAPRPLCVLRSASCCCCRPGRRCCICKRTVPRMLIGVMAIVWIADTAAYFAGRRFGRHKLAPAISPGKTWEGVGGAFAALAAVRRRLEPAGRDAAVVVVACGVRAAVCVGAG